MVLKSSVILILVVIFPLIFVKCAENSKCVKMEENKYSAKNCSLENIDLGSKEQRKSLKIVIASENKISKIDDEMFDSATELYNIDLSENQIKIISENAFADQGKLVELKLNKNHIYKISSEVLKPLQNLEEIWLQENKIEIIRNNLFSNNKNIKKMDLKSNKILAIGPQAFVGLAKLAEVIIYDNICVDDKYGKIVMEDQKLYVTYSEKGCFKDTIDKTEFSNLKCIINYDFITEKFESCDHSSNSFGWLIGFVVAETLIILVGIGFIFKNELIIWTSYIETFINNIIQMRQAQNRNTNKFEMRNASTVSRTRINPEAISAPMKIDRELKIETAEDLEDPVYSVIVKSQK